MKKILLEFKEFISKGNVFDMAIGVIIGNAFSKIVTSLVNDIFTPLIGLLIGGLNFSSLSITAKDATIAYGAFIQNVIDFLIVAACIFMVVKLINKLKRKQVEESVVPAKTDEVLLLEEIRDLLKKKK